MAEEQPAIYVFDIVIESFARSTYSVSLLELHDELFVTLVWVEHFFLACVKQDLYKMRTVISNAHR